jgi:hypothetical protein
VARNQRDNAFFNGAGAHGAKNRITGGIPPAPRLRRNRFTIEAKR